MYIIHVYLYVWYVWSGRGVSLTRGVRLLFISDFRWITVTTTCSQLQMVSRRNMLLLLLWAPSVASDIWKTQVQPIPAIFSYLLSVLNQPITAALLCVQALLYICPRLWLFHSTQCTPVSTCIFYSSEVWLIKKTHAICAITERHHSVENKNISHYEIRAQTCGGISHDHVLIQIIQPSLRRSWRSNVGVTDWITKLAGAK